MKPLAIIGSGMLTGVGLDAPSSCAAIRCAIDNFSETRFMDKGGEWIIASQVPLEQPWRGLPKLVHIVVPAIRECLASAGGVRTEEIPLVLCVAEEDRPGRFSGMDDELFSRIESELGLRFHRRSAVIAKGRVGGALAMLHARNILYENVAPLCLIAGVDTFLTAGTLAAYEDRHRLLTSKNSNGFIPGEGAAAVLVGAGRDANVTCLGIGAGRETATVESEEPLRADGMVEAFRAALADSSVSMANVDYRITDSNGEQYWFKEAALAVTRTLRTHKALFEIWHPADCIGEVGAASGPCALAVALAAARKNYAPGPGILCHFSGEDTERFAMVLQGPGGEN